MGLMSYNKQHDTKSLKSEVAAIPTMENEEDISQMSATQRQQEQRERHNIIGSQLMNTAGWIDAEYGPQYINYKYTYKLPYSEQQSEITQHSNKKHNMGIMLANRQDSVDSLKSEAAVMPTMENEEDLSQISATQRQQEQRERHNIIGSQLMNTAGWIDAEYGPQYINYKYTYKLPYSEQQSEITQHSNKKHNMGIMLANRQDSVDSLNSEVAVMPTMENEEDISQMSATQRQQEQREKHNDIANQLEVIAGKIDAEYGPQLREVIQPSGWFNMTNTCLFVCLTGLLSIGYAMKK